MGKPYQCFLIALFISLSACSMQRQSKLSETPLDLPIKAEGDESNANDVTLTKIEMPVGDLFVSNGLDLPNSSLDANSKYAYTLTPTGIEPVQYLLSNGVTSVLPIKKTIKITTDLTCYILTNGSTVISRASDGHIFNITNIAASENITFVARAGRLYMGNVDTGMIYKLSLATMIATGLRAVDWTGLRAS